MDLRPLVNRSLAVVALSYGVLLTLAQAAGLFGIALNIVVILSLWRYSYEVLRYVAQGRQQIPVPELDSMNPVSDFSVLGHFLAVVALIAIWFLATGRLGEGAVAGLLRWTGISTAVAAFPASAALMGLTGNLAHSLNPLAVGGVIKVLRHRYLVLLAACAGVFLLSLLLQDLLALRAGLLALALGNVVTVWTVLAVFVLIGSAIYECRDELYIPGESETREERTRRHAREHRIRDWQHSLDRAYASISGGLVTEGYQTLKQLVTAEHNSLDVYQWLYDNMLTWEDKRHALQIGRRFIGRLVEEGQQHDALAVYSRCRHLSADFAVPAESAEVLAASARSMGRQGLADEIEETARR